MFADEKRWLRGVPHLHRIHELFARYRERAGLSPTELAQRAGVSPPWIFMIEGGKRTPNQELVDSVVNILRLSLDEAAELRREALYARTDDEGRELFDRYGSAAPPPSDDLIPVVAIPVLSKCPGGGPDVHTSGDYPPGVAAEYTYVSADVVRANPGAFAMRIVGDSMSPRYPDGSLVVSAPDRPPEVGKAAIVCFDGGELTCKIWRPANGTVVLYPVNENHAPLVVERQRIVSAHRVLLAITVEK